MVIERRPRDETIILARISDGPSRIQPKTSTYCSSFSSDLLFFFHFAADAAVTCNSVEVTLDSGTGAMCAGKTIKNHKGCFDASLPASDPKSRDAYIKVGWNVSAKRDSSHDCLPTDFGESFRMRYWKTAVFNTRDFFMKHSLSHESIACNTCKLL
jgi:hypothetical protein